MADQEVVERPTEEQIIAPGYSFASVTDQIAAVVLTKHTPVFWFASFSVAIGLLLLFLLAVAKLFFLGVGVWGLRTPSLLGLGHYEFRVVDRYRPRRNPHLRDSAAAQPTLAQFDQPFRRGHDAVRRGLRGHVSHPPPGPSLADVLALPVPQHHDDRAELPQPPGMGRVRRLHLRHGLGAVLVRGTHPRPGHAARPRRPPRPEDRLRRVGARLARQRAALVAVRDGFAPAGRSGDTAGA